MMILSLRERKKVSGWNYRGSNGYCRHDRIKHGVLNLAIAQNANTKLEIGDVTIPKFWAHTGLWLWQKCGEGHEDELPLESNGDYTRTISYIKFSDYNNDTTTENKKYFKDNLFNKG
ncbi:hypothetical protein Tco_1333967 [Tanacetum coccineum]